MICLIYPDAPGAKGPETSAEAAAAQAETAEALRIRCLAHVRLRDQTADECATALGVSILSVRPRFSELAARQQIFDSGVRRANASGHKAIVWTAKPPTPPTP
ncbi:MAG: hypothetical protein KGL39_15805 [Patescibacteria group bacterium]|nr:hypothetical protein [Patescibacteria group bacterium]